MAKALVAYYTWTNGNTEKIARRVADALGADVDRIDVATPYPSDYQATVDQGKREVEAGFEPALKVSAHDPADYDLIAIGTPTWWYTMAPAVRSYLHGHDWTGKTVVPFMTNAGWPGTVIADMEAAAAGARVQAAHEFRFDHDGGPAMVTKQAELDSWIAEVKALAN